MNFAFSSYTPSIQNGPFIPGATILFDAAKKLVSPGMNGPFCIEGVYDENAKFTSFEFSARIVAGTNIYMDGSPYYSLLFNEPMSMGRRIAREIKTAAESNQLDKVTT